ncbi:hypothetical protein [Hymenobacter cheonanensis]|uniref:hypothetical protein n=1 Tax=Hymenobacter sp. CA2-7 TaxID=3063993 RepID=UPI00271315A1|nr:hypothetical protein [Hymenobacter sp. CA2-7]MDO7884799.1 hypothetical protein [Hymenobacter sp. CA2-7]
MYGAFAAAADTVLHLPGHTYRLGWQVRLDTLQPLTHITPPDPAKYFAGDTSRGFRGYYTVEVRDSLGQRLGRHTFTKADFYPVVGPELAISSGVELPRLLGYSAPLGGLVYTVSFNAPGTDWYGEAVLVLAPGGQVRYLGPGAGSDGPELAVTLAANGQTLLTGNGIKRAGQPLLPLARAGAELRGARLLNDTLALLIDEPGRSHLRASAEPSFDATPAQRRQPNAFVRDVRTGRDVSRFRYDGFFYVLGYRIPLQIVASTQTAYLLDAAKGIYVLPLRQPAAGRWLPFATMPRAVGSPMANEISFELSGEPQGYRFLVDTTQASKVRYQLLTQ